MRRIRIGSRLRNARNRPPAVDEGGRPEYDIGYRHPPVASRFKPGVPGNPKGRPKALKRLDIYKEIQRVFTQEIIVRNGEQTRRVPGIVAFVHKILVDAIKGDRKAITLCYKIAEDFNVLDFKEDLPVDLSVLTKEERERCLSVLPLIRKAGGLI